MPCFFSRPMTDTLTLAERSERMSRVKAKNTGPELRVRRLVHRLGYRYRLHGRGLPGKPDLVFPRRRAVIFVHGCFWHRHPDPGCKLARLPKSRETFWGPKLDANRERDERNRSALASAGWRVLELWECQLSDSNRLEQTIREFLGGQ
jgi:DNA mismatch endonuclease (patch repair protein)